MKPPAYAWPTGRATRLSEFGHTGRASLEFILNMLARRSRPRPRPARRWKLKAADAAAWLRIKLQPMARVPGLNQTARGFLLFWGVTRRDKSRNHNGTQDRNRPPRRFSRDP